MSSDRSSSVNSETIEQTKQQIRGLVSEIAQLSKSNLGPEEYYAAFLQRIVSALAAVGGAVWMLGESRRPELRYQINLSETLLNSASPEAGKHVNLLQHVIANQEPCLIPPQSGTADESAGNPTRYLLVLAPLIADGQVEGVVEVFQRPDSQPATQRGYLKFLIQMAELAGEWLKSQKLRQFSDRHSLWAQADHFARLVHESLNARETSYTIVNEGRRMIGCDRVSIAIKRGNKCIVEAISGQDTIEDRSNIVTALNQLTTRVAATEEPLWYDGSTEDLPPQVERAIEDYVDESYAKSLVVLPIRRPKSADERTGEHVGDVAQETNEGNEIIGAMVVEQIETDLPREVIAPRVDLVYEHSARALANALDHSSILFVPVLRAINKLSVVVAARNLPKTITITALVIAILAALFLVPWDFDLKAKGVLQPVERQDVFAWQSGRVQEVLVKDKQMVKKGQPLVLMVNEDLDFEIEDLEKQWQSTFQQARAARKTMFDKTLSRSEKVSAAKRYEELQSTLTSLETQRKLLEKKKSHLTVKSPIDGQVIINWDVEKSLKNRTIEPGQVLMTVADLEKDWEIELYMREGRIQHVNRAQQAIRPDLDVEYILATDPGTTHYGKVIEVAPTAAMHEQEGSAVRIRVKIDKEEIPDRRPGATVTGGVKCGTAPLGYTWFYEVIAWVQANVLF